jgi:hypothetical protein
MVEPKNYTVIIPTNRPELAKSTMESIKPFHSTIFNGTGYTSYSKLINDVIVSCPTELVLICHDKGWPTPKDVETVVSLIEEGYGMVWLHPFGFGGFYKDLIRKIGFYDERFADGNYEDCDMLLRLKENNIGVYEQCAVKWVQMQSSWGAKKSAEFMRKKWKETPPTIERLLPDDIYSYNIGKNTGRKFLPYNKSILSQPNNAFNKFIIIKNSLSPKKY